MAEDEHVCYLTEADIMLIEHCARANVAEMDFSEFWTDDEGDEGDD